MHELEIAGRLIPTDNEGFLLNPADWDIDVANKLAETLRIDMSEHHWEVVRFIREYYEQTQTVPEARHALKDLGNKLGKEIVNRKFLYALFPYGYGQQACKIAGMRKPLKLMLDV